MTAKELLSDFMDYLFTNEYIIDQQLMTMQEAPKDYIKEHQTLVNKLGLSDVSKSVAKQYAEFCVRCDREGLPLLELDDYIKQYCC